MKVMFLRVFSILVALFACAVWFRYLRDTDVVRTPKTLNPQYDYIIVGGGSAGCVLASRLSEDPQTTVLLLEAGDYELPFSHVPGMVPLLQQTNMDWGLKTEKQDRACLGMVNQTCLWPRGKVLGGTSVLNYMIHVRGFPQDYNWGPEWNWESVLPFFNKLESVSWKSENRGSSGPISVKKSPRTELGRVFMKVVESLGYNINDDYNDNPSQGFSVLDLSVDASGRRSSTSNKYIRPAMSRFNLHVVKGAHVTKINFNENNQAVGVDYLFEGKKQRVLINKEIILSAGSVHSPQIMMLSGIGPKEHLKQHNIDLVVESPQVGQNLKDHLLFVMSYKVNDSQAVVDGHALFRPIGAIREAYNYLFKSSGVFSWSLVELQGMISSGINNHLEPGEPDLQVYLFPTDVFLDGFWNYMIQYTPQTLKSVIGNGDGDPKFTVAVVLMHPQSSGTIQLRSDNPTDSPRIDPKYFSENVDLHKMRKGIRAVDKIVQSNEFQRFASKSLEEIHPSCASHKFWSDGFIDCLLAQRASTIYHPMGSCRMGSDVSQGVVDSHFRVFGVEGVRIVDASVFPNSISGNTNIPTIMLAERAAQWIKDGM